MNGGKGPCGACKFLRRKCTKGCVFAPYFDRDHGGSDRFAAVHRVFGASNASKILQRVPPHKRLDAVATLCYEAMARIRDPVYGCLASLFTLQQQVAKLRGELAYVQARLTIMQSTTIIPLPEAPVSWTSNIPMSNSSDEFHSPTTFRQHPQHMSSMELMNDATMYLLDQEEASAEEDDLHALAREFVSTHLAEVVKLPHPSSTLN